MNILVVDDEEACLKDTVAVIKKVVPDANIARAKDAEIALALCRRDSFDVAFLDINMPGKDGIELAKEIKEILPLINIIMLTAYSEYAVDAFKLYVSGYLLKPAIAAEVERALSNLRYPVTDDTKGLYVRCLGDFEVFFDGVPVKFGRSKSKELLAFLIHQKGGTVTNADIRAALWGDELDEDRQKKYLTQIVYDLKKTLSSLGLSDLIIQSRDSYSVRTKGYACDYYMALKKDPKEMEAYNGEYMTGYSWAQK